MYNTNEMASQTRKNVTWICPSAIDWIAVICYC